jgi:hypothetical protein
LYPSYKTPVVVIEWFVQFYCRTLIPSIEQFVEVLLPSDLERSTSTNCSMDKH